MNAPRSMARDANAPAEIHRLHKAKSHNPPAATPLGEQLLSFFKQSVDRRHTKLAKISECWVQLVPANLCEHCALESLSRGSLTVKVDNSSHLYELRQLLLAGLQDQLILAARSTGLRKIVLRPGRWYDGDHPAERRVRFQ